MDTGAFSVLFSVLLWTAIAVPGAVLACHITLRIFQKLFLDLTHGSDHPLFPSRRPALPPVCAPPHSDAANSDVSTTASDRAAHQPKSILDRLLDETPQQWLRSSPAPPPPPPQPVVEATRIATGQLVPNWLMPHLFPAGATTPLPLAQVLPHLFREGEPEPEDLTSLLRFPLTDPNNPNDPNVPVPEPPRGSMVVRVTPGGIVRRHYEALVARPPAEDIDDDGDEEGDVFSDRATVGSVVEVM